MDKETIDNRKDNKETKEAIIDNKEDLNSAFDSKLNQMHLNQKPLHDNDVIDSKMSFENSIGISLLNSEPNNNNTNNNNTKIEFSNTFLNQKGSIHFNNFDSNPFEPKFESITPLKARPYTFWILHLFSVEKNEMTSSTVAKLLNEKYGLDVDERTVSMELSLLAKKGILKRRKPLHINAVGRGGIRKVYYYSYVSLDKLCQEMAKYDSLDSLYAPKNGPRKLENNVVEVLKEHNELLREHNSLLKQIVQIISDVMMKLDLR